MKRRLKRFLPALSLVATLGFCSSAAAELPTERPADAEIQHDTAQSLEELRPALLAQVDIEAPSAQDAASSSPSTATDAGPAGPNSDRPPLNPDSTGSLFMASIDMFRAGKYLLGAAPILVLIGVYLRKGVGLVAKDFAKSETGGKILGFGSGALVSFGVAVWATGKLNLDVLALSVAGGIGGAGLYSLLPSSWKAKLKPQEKPA